MAYSKAQEKAISEGRCCACKEPRGDDGAKVYCRKCADIMRDRNAGMRKKRSLNGQCATCGKESIRLECLECRRKHQKLENTNRERRILAGICPHCPKPLTRGTTRCADHVLAQMALASLGNYHLGVGLMAKFNAQEGRCFYTGLPMEIGVDASLDHRKPRSKFPLLAKSMDNLVWCHRTVNFAKRDLTDDEFIRLCKLVAAHA